MLSVTLNLLLVNGTFVISVKYGQAYALAQSLELHIDMSKKWDN